MASDEMGGRAAERSPREWFVIHAEEVCWLHLEVLPLQRVPRALLSLSDFAHYPWSNKHTGKTNTRS